MSGIPDPTCITWIGQGSGASGSNNGDIFQPTSPSTGTVVAKPVEPDPTSDQLTPPSDECDDPGGICDAEWDNAQLGQDAIDNAYCDNCANFDCVFDTYGESEEGIVNFDACYTDVKCCHDWSYYHHYVAVHESWVTYNTWLNTPSYTQVFDPAQATTDAKNALLEWIGPHGACNLTSQETSGCCIAIYMASSPSDWTEAAQAANQLDGGNNSFDLLHQLG